MVLTVIKIGFDKRRTVYIAVQCEILLELFLTMSLKKNQTHNSE